MNKKRVLISEQDIENVLNEAKSGSYPEDRLYLLFNKQGYEKYKDKLETLSSSSVPVYKIDLSRINYRAFLKNILRLFPYLKGIMLVLVSPQKRRHLVNFLNNAILTYIGHTEIENVNNVISELTANAEKANFEDVIRSFNLTRDGRTVKDVLVKERDKVINLARRLAKRVQIHWKFSRRIYKIEIRNNTIISGEGITMIQNKLSQKISHLAEGFVGETDTTLGAGLGLFFVNFFADEIKEKYDFDCIFRIYDSMQKDTVTTLTIFFEK